MILDTLSERKLPSVSVLLPAWNDEQMVGRCLESLLAIDWPNLEIIVCAGGQDNTLAVARRYEGERVTVFEQHFGEGKQVALRHCFARSIGDIIYLTDADCVVPDETFSAIMGPITDGCEQVVTGDSEPFHDLMRYSIVQYQHHLDVVSSRHLGDYTVGLHGRNTILARDVVEAAGAFTWAAPTGTDYSLAEELHRIGVRIRHISNANVLTEYPTTLQGYVRQRSRWLRNLVLLGARYRRWSLMLSTLASSLALSCLVPTPVLVLSRYRRPKYVIGLVWLLLGVKRSISAVRNNDTDSSWKLTLYAGLMTPVEVWIRMKSLAELCIPSLRWRW